MIITTIIIHDVICKIEPAFPRPSTKDEAPNTQKDSTEKTGPSRYKVSNSIGEADKLVQ
jgi:hypothetical protein